MADMKPKVTIGGWRLPRWAYHKTDAGIRLTFWGAWLFRVLWWTAPNGPVHVDYSENADK